MVSITPPSDFKPKTFWQRPEGVTGGIFMTGIIVGLGYLLYKMLPILITLVSNTLYLALLLIALAAVIYMVVDPRMRNLFWYGYKSIMRWITGIFVNLDPIGILKSYVEDLENNLSKMSKQIGNLRGSMRKLKTTMEENDKSIENELNIANAAKKQGNEKQLVLSTRQAARLKDSNEKYNSLYSKMDILHRILAKMYENSEILLEDTRDQVKVKQEEREAIRASHSAMSSAMKVISGDKDKKAMFDMALEAIADDVSKKVGEMERFMDLSSNFMDSIDLNNGIFEEEGLKMLEKWEREGASLLLGGEKDDILRKSNDDNDVLDLNTPIRLPEKVNRTNQYDDLFK